MTDELLLRDMTAHDLPVLFKHQLDRNAHFMVAFTTGPEPADRATFMQQWAKRIADDTVIKKTVLVNGAVAGYVISFLYQGRREVGYWLGRQYWGRGLGTSALAALLRHIAERPLYAAAAKDNHASRRVLEKCGFNIYGEGRAFAKARGADIEEWYFILEAHAEPGERFLLEAEQP